MLLADFLASWASSACGTLIMHPVDTLRVRYQTRGHSPLYTLRNERWIALYSGIVTPVTVGGPINALVFMSNDGIKEAVYRMLVKAKMIEAPTTSGGNSVAAGEASAASSSPSSNGLSSSTAYASSSSDPSCHAPKLPMWAVMLCGGAAGCVGTIVACPAATIRVQQQVRAISSHLGGAKPTNPAEAKAAIASSKRNLAPVTEVVSDLLKTEGFRGLYRAVGLECLTNIVGRSTYFGLYEGFKRLFGRAYVNMGYTAPNTSPHDAEMLIPVRVTAASVASVISWWSIYPLDLLKNKLQAEPTVRADRLYGNGSIRECARITYKAGGWRAFYVGFPITAIRGSCTGMINLPLYDSLKPVFRKRLGEEGYGVDADAARHADDDLEATVVSEKSL